MALQVAAAHRAGLAVVPSICGGACANLSGAWGFQIADEPRVGDFPQVARLVAEAKAAGQMAFVNLLPNYASSPGQTGAPTYDAYVKQFVDDVRPNMLSVDHYPDFDATTPRSNKTKAGYILNMLTLRSARSVGVLTVCWPCAGRVLAVGVPHRVATRFGGVALPCTMIPCVPPHVR